MFGGFKKTVFLRSFLVNCLKYSQVYMDTMLIEVTNQKGKFVPFKKIVTNC